MAGIKTIAKKAGVSISTVSYALNGSNKVKEETRQRILKIADELAYVPNAAARTLKTRKTRIIGAFLADFTGTFYGSLLIGMREALEVAGYELIVCNGQYSHRLLSEGMVDGAIVLDANFSDADLLKFANRGHKIVVLDRDIEHSRISNVLIDNVAGVMKAMQFLRENGYREIYCLHGPEDTYDSNVRKRGVSNFQQVHQEIELHFYNGFFSKKGGYQIATQIIKKEKLPMTLFCFNDEMAIGVYDYAKDHGYRIGEDIQIIGFDNVELAQYVIPELTTIDYDRYKWGEIAANELLKLFADEKVTHHFIPVRLELGQSVKLK